MTYRDQVVRGWLATFLDFKTHAPDKWTHPRRSMYRDRQQQFCVSQGQLQREFWPWWLCWEGSAYELNELQVQKSTARVVEYRVTVVTQNPGKLGTTSAFQSHGVWMDHVGKEALGICGARARLVDRNGCGLYLQDEGLHVPLVQLGTLLLLSHCWFSPAAFRI